MEPFPVSSLSPMPTIPSMVHFDAMKDRLRRVWGVTSLVEATVSSLILVGGWIIVPSRLWRMIFFFARFASEDEAARAVIRSMSAAGVTMRVANFVFGADVGEITR